jgi:hypothetical protein
MAESKEFIAWVKEQAKKHPADSKITNLDKLTNKYILNKYKTWGDLYDSVGVKEEIQKPKSKSEPVVSEEIKALQNALSKTERDLFNYETKKPKPTWDVEPAPGQVKADDPIAAINKLIKASPAGSAQRQKYMDQKAAYEKKLSFWNNKLEQYSSVYNSARKALTAAEKLTALTRQQQDNKDTGVTDSKLDAEVNKLTETVKVESNKVGVDIKPSTVGTPAVIAKPTGETGAGAGTGAGTGAGAGTNAGASTGAGAGAGVKEKTAAELEAEALNTAAEKDFALPETLFKNIPSLNALLKKYVDEKWTPDKLRKAIRDDLWFKQNSAEIKKRYVQYYNFRDLQASGQAKGTTDYEMQIDKIEATLKKRAVALGSAAASDPAALRKAAENLYITNRSEDESFVTDLLAASIRPIAGTIGGKTTEGYSGQALGNYNLLVKAARDNGFQVSDIIPGGASEQQVLQGIAAGTIDINRVIADTRKIAAQGQPQYVRDLLAQGYNLNQVYAPYRQTMANILEIDDPNQIPLNDPTLRDAITDKGDMNIYDFKKLLRRDDRWQYTEQAKQDVSTAALDVLRDFGFQG